MTIDGTTRTRIVAGVKASSKDEAREVGLAGVGHFARQLRLTAEPAAVDVTP